MSDEITLPLARVKRIIKQDVDIHSVSNTAVYAVSAATKLFITHMTEQAAFAARGSGRARLNYSDFASAVARSDELEFLSSIVPKTQTYGQVAVKRVEAELENTGQPFEPGPDLDEPEDGAEHDDEDHDEEQGDVTATEEPEDREENERAYKGENDSGEESE